MARIEAAERLGISPRRLDGWEPAETTTYDYDDAGRLVRSVTVREPEWSEQDRAWMLALVGYRASLCPTCGGPIEECGPESEGRWQVPPPRRCYRMDVLAVEQKNSKRPRPEALMWRVVERR